MTRALRLVPGSASEPRLHEPVPPYEIAQRSARRVLEGRARQIAEQHRQRNHRRVGFVLWVVGVLALAVLGGLALNQWGPI